MPHIHTNDGQHDFTTSAYIVRWIGGTPCVLLIMHKKLERLLQPGGHVELDETPWQALQHELLEEVGYELSQLKIMQPESTLTKLPEAVLHPVPASVNTHNFDATSYIHSHTDLAYVMTTDEDPLHDPEQGESTDLRWVTEVEALQAPETLISKSSKALISNAIVIAASWHSIPTDRFTH